MHGSACSVALRAQRKGRTGGVTADQRFRVNVFGAKAESDSGWRRSELTVTDGGIHLRRVIERRAELLAVTAPQLSVKGGRGASIARRSRGAPARVEAFTLR